MANLATDFTFTNGDDLAIVENEKIVNDSFVFTRGGDDTIEASLFGDGGDIGSAIENSGLITTGFGSDSIIGRRFGFEGNGILNHQFAVIKTNSGNDSIIGSSRGFGAAIRNEGTILMGVGNDLIDATDVGFLGSGIVNDQGAVIRTGFGNDSIIASGGFQGGSAIGNSGLITTGFGNDSISTTAGGKNFAPEFINRGTISMGIGNDTLTGRAIDNSGTISMGVGDDFISGSFIGGGVTNLAIGNDSVSLSVFPFESNFQTIDGGRGFDQVEFSFELDNNVELDISGNVVELTRSGSTWTLRNFESFEFQQDATFSLSELISAIEDSV